MRYLVRTWLAALLALPVPGCATIFAPQPQPVPVRSVPSGADVSVDGVVVGTTPLTLALDARRPYEVRLVLDGRERVVVLESGVDGTYVALDVVPGVGVAAASLALALSCNEAFQCLLLSAAAPTGIAVGLGMAAVATVTDAGTGAWMRLTPREIVVEFE